MNNKLIGNFWKAKIKPKLDDPPLFLMEVRNDHQKRNIKLLSTKC
jgi:hypothetical protein